MWSHLLPGDVVLDKLGDEVQNKLDYHDIFI